MSYFAKSQRLLTQSALAAALALPLVWVSTAASKKVVARTTGRIPSRIVLTWGDPARTQAVTWRAGTVAENPQAQIALLNANPDAEKSATRVAAKCQTLELPGGKTAGHCSARFEDLAPGKYYNYRVGDGTTWSEWNVFRTASDRPGPFRFLYVGDAQNDIHSMWSRTIRSAYAAVPDARFVIYAGDLVADGFNDNLWGEWCEALGFISAMVPSLPVPGNHDLHRAPGSLEPDNPFRAAEPWNWHFALPLNGPAGLEGQSYYLDYQGARFISLDVNVLTGKGGYAGQR